MIWIIYNLVFLLLFPLMIPRFLLRMRRRGGYRSNFAQRIGIYDPELKQRIRSRPRVWVHAVSVGEVNLAVKFIQTWKDHDPDVSFVLSLTTSTGYQIARQRLSENDEVVYFPVDFPGIIHRVVWLIRPQMLVLVESEFWPNLLRIMNRKKVPVALINGRISDRSYPRYLKVRWITRPVLKLVDIFCMQSRQDAERITAMGADPDRVRIMNSAKYEVAQRSVENEEAARRVLDQAGFPADAPVIMGGSTWDGEETAMLEVLTEAQKINPDTRLLLAPRHAERGPEIAELLTEKEISFVRRSQLDEDLRTVLDPDVFLLDTTGELMAFYGTADVIFVGKSLHEHGAQNMIEPAMLGKPVVLGPNIENFRKVMAELLEANAIYQVADAAELTSTFVRLLNNPQEAVETGTRAAAFVKAKTGAVTRTVEVMSETLNAAS